GWWRCSLPPPGGGGEENNKRGGGGLASGALLRSRQPAAFTPDYPSTTLRVVRLPEQARGGITPPPYPPAPSAARAPRGWPSCAAPRPPAARAGSPRPGGLP